MGFFNVHRPMQGSSLVGPPISRPISKLANKEPEVDPEVDKENETSETIDH